MVQASLTTSFSCLWGAEVETFTDSAVSRFHCCRIAESISIDRETGISIDQKVIKGD